MKQKAWEHSVEIDSSVVRRRARRHRSSGGGLDQECTGRSRGWLTQGQLWIQQHRSRGWQRHGSKEWRLRRQHQRADARQARILLRRRLLRAVLGAEPVLIRRVVRHVGLHAGTARHGSHACGCHGLRLARKLARVGGQDRLLKKQREQRQHRQAQTSAATGKRTLAQRRKHEIKGTPSSRWPQSRKGDGTPQVALSSRHDHSSSPSAAGLLCRSAIQSWWKPARPCVG